MQRKLTLRLNKSIVIKAEKLAKQKQLSLIDVSKNTTLQYCFVSFAVKMYVH
jgi:hypothetical protein